MQQQRRGPTKAKGTFLDMSDTGCHVENVISATSSDLLETLKTIIAPGRRTRLSPLIEAAQFQVLFNRRPDPKRRYEDARSILAKHKNKIENLAHRWVAFVQGGKQFNSDNYEENFLSAYLTYYFSTNVCKLQLILLELAKREKLTSEMTVVDIGVGTGTTAIAVLDFLIAWANTCDLYGATFPIQSVKFIGLDSSKQCLNYARKTLHAYADALAERLQLCSDNVHGCGILKQAQKWAKRAKWLECDLNVRSVKMLRSRSLLVASNVLNELGENGRNNLGRAISSLSPGSMAILIEPGDGNSTKNLNKWHRELLQKEHDLIPIAPCGEEHHGQQPWQCGECWNARRESLHKPPLYENFRKAAVGLLPDSRRFDDFENKLLSWSYICLLRDGDPGYQATKPEMSAFRESFPTRVMRYIGSFNTLEPLADGPDDSDSSTKKEWVEFIKLCPGGDDQARDAVLVRHPGFEVPLLSHGEWVVIENVKEEHNNGGLRLIPHERTQLSLIGEPSKANNTFLPVYSKKARQAVDEIAYRLFGFTAMYPLQHRILERVLQGGNILAIAATGGGKSECFILPAMLLPGITIVVSPLKALMQDQYEQRLCKRFGLDHLSTFINGDVPFKERQARLRRLELGYYKLVYFTPEQLERGYVLDSLKNANAKTGIRFLALDEAHCISQWGHDFRPSYLNLVRRLKKWGIDPVRIALTATASPEVRDDLCEELELNPAPLEAGGDVYVHSSNRPELNLIVRVLQDTAAKADLIVEDLQSLLLENQNNQNPGAAIVFLPHTGGNPDNTYKYLTDHSDEDSQRGRLSAGVTPFASYLERVLKKRVAIYHSKIELDSKSDSTESEESNKELAPIGDLSGRGRRGEQEAFINGEREIMVATKGFGMGIDKPNIRLVIHRTPPINLEAYVQEAGRAGRDGDLADVILYHSPDSPEGFYGRKESSDYEIQEFFLSEKYIRREDVVVMRAFLRTVYRRVGPYLYFTNDEAIDYFDRCSENGIITELKEPYSWPGFQEREPGKYEYDEHREILDRGHMYEQKTRYIDRILSVLYRIRPDLAEEKKRLAILERFQETGARLIKPQIKNVERILSSNSYFGRLLRDKGMTPNEFKTWVEECTNRDLLKFAEHLDLSPSETAALFQDIKRADGRFGANGDWNPDLMDFSIIAAPKYGPAAEKKSLPAWREYAGAKRRASKTVAQKRAKEEGRQSTTVDDWFSWSEVNYSRGWEVLTGPAFKIDQEFEQYLDAFMALHDRREQNDWAAYGRLLTDYVGVDENGNLRPAESRNCLRAVMLGYLKTYEVVTNDNCFACSRCVEGGKFEQNIELRKKAVVSLGSVITQLLDELEKSADRLPPTQMTEAFWQNVETEEQAGRSLISYVEGWTGRLLTDTPGHRAALWLRVTGMAREFISLQPGEFVENARQLVLQKDFIEEELGQFWTIFSKAHHLLPDNPEVLALQATACHRLSQHSEEEEKWQSLLVHRGLKKNLEHEAHVALSALYAPRGPLDSPDNYNRHILMAGRTVSNLAESIGYYQVLLDCWDWQRLEDEIVWLEENERPDKVALSLFSVWLKIDHSEEKLLYICSHLREKERYRRYSPTDFLPILQQIDQNILEKFPDLASYYLDLQAEILGSIDEKESFVKLAMLTAMKGETLSKEVALLCGQILFENLPPSIIESLCSTCLSNKDSLELWLELISSQYQPHNSPALCSWLEVFSPLLSAGNPQTALKLLEMTAEQIDQLSYEQVQEVSEKIHDRLRYLVPELKRKPELKDAAHRAWLRICSVLPDEAIHYLHDCLTSKPPAIQMAEECLELLIQQEGTYNKLKELFTWIRVAEIKFQSERFDRALELVQLLERLIAESDIARSDQLNSSHFKTLSNVFMPEKDRSRADMVVALINRLRRQVSPKWLTPIGYHFQVLCYAARFDEAREMALEYPELEIGPNCEPASSFLARYSSGKEARPAPVNDADYVYLIRNLTKNWALCTKDRRRASDLAKLS
jgi:superfamily II DNA helicase RecQ